MIVTVTGIGLWTRGLHGWQDFCDGLEDGFRALEDEFQAPKPGAIAARERRRAGLTINLAVEVMHQACEMGGAEKPSIASVFASAMGDTDVTDYMCRKLASDEKLLSPTRFHNSVHNATSGYWSISASNRQPSSFVGGFRESFACGLLEASACALEEDLAVGLAAYDIVNAAPFDDVLPVSETLGLAMLMLPGAHDDGWRLELTMQRRTGLATPPRHPALRRLAHANPIGTGLALLEAMAEGAARELEFPLGSGSSLRVVVGAGGPGESRSGDRSHTSASGDRSHTAASGDRSHSSVDRCHR